jgi:hypothetical protein
VETSRGRKLALLWVIAGIEDALMAVIDFVGVLTLAWVAGNLVVGGDRLGSRGC